jgi:DNA-binding GntR family transcriptional regulator
MHGRRPPDFTPLYYRIEERIRARIGAGEFREGDRLPSETELAREFRTTRVTVRQALTRLVFEGLIVRETGRGTFVARPRVESTVETSIQQSFEEQMESKGSKVTFRLLGFEPVPAPPAAAKTLGIEAGHPVHRLERLRFVDGELLGVELRYLVPALGARIPREALASQSAIDLVEVSASTPIGQILVTVRAGTASRELARKLEIPRGSPVLVREHAFLGLDGRPLLCGDAVYRGDKYQVSYTLRKGAAGGSAP